MTKGKLKLDISRSIELNVEDWLRATWRVDLLVLSEVLRDLTALVSS